MQNNLGG